MRNKWSKFKYYISEFHTIWVIFVILMVAGFSAFFGLWGLSKGMFFFALLGFLIFVASKPMNAVYGLNGTSGNINHFIWLAVIFNMVFSIIYFCGFLRNAGITYDINQPYVSYGMFYNVSKGNDTTITHQNEIRSESTESKSYYISQKKTESGEAKFDTIIVVSPPIPTTHYYEEKHSYNRISWPKVLQNTLMTSLMQEPTELFSCCSVYNNINSKEEQNLNGFKDEESCRFFTWILLVQVFISWIFFGVFISILYNKFRYES